MVNGTDAVLTAVIDAEEYSCSSTSTPIAITGIGDVQVMQRYYTPVGSEAYYRLVESSDVVMVDDLLLVVTADAMLASDSDPIRRSPRLTCAPSLYESTQVVSRVELVSDSDWSTGLSVGNSLADVVVLEAPYNRLQTLSEYNDAAPVAPLLLSMVIRSTDRIQQHRFTVTYHLSDGSVYSAMSAPVVVQPTGPVESLTGTAWRLISYTDATGAVYGGDANTFNEIALGFGPQLRQIHLQIKDRGSCEYNVRISDNTIELRGEDDLDPMVFSNGGCFFNAGQASMSELFLEQFFTVGFLQYQLSASGLTVQSANNESLFLEIVR